MPKAPIVQAFKTSWRDMLRVVCMALMNVIPVVATIFGAAYAVQPAYGIGFKADVYLWIPVLGNIAAVLVIPLVGNLSDKIGRRPPIIVGALCSGLLAFGYLYAISIKNVPMAIALSILMWGIVYQGYNAVFPSFYPELFQTSTACRRWRFRRIPARRSPHCCRRCLQRSRLPGRPTSRSRSARLPLRSRPIAAIAACPRRETFRLPVNDLGNPDAAPMAKQEYERLRAASFDAAATGHENVGEPAVSGRRNRQSRRARGLPPGWHQARHPATIR